LIIKSFNTFKPVVYNVKKRRFSDESPQANAGLRKPNGIIGSGKVEIIENQP